MKDNNEYPEKGVKTVTQIVHNKLKDFIWDKSSDYKFIIDNLPSEKLFEVINEYADQFKLQPANNDYVVKVVENNGWISITNPPKKDGVYLVWGSAYADTPRQLLRCNYYKKVFKSDNCAGVKTKNITHWMPLPSPPTIKPIKL